MFRKALAFAALFSAASAFEGDGTFYGAGGNGAWGACQLTPGFNGVGVTVAMNAAQFGGSCGSCVRITGNGVGAGGTPIFGPIYATVDNLCPECRYGDIDLGLGGDGRWRINWDFVSCDEARGGGSHLPRFQHRQLRADAAAAANQTTYLAPGFMVTKDGIKLIADVVAEANKGN